MSKQSQLSYDPYYALAFHLRLYWHFSERTLLTAAQSLEVELTDSESTSSRQKPLLSDTDLRINQRLWKLAPASERSLAVDGAIRVTAPTSLASQAADVVLGIGPRLATTLTFRDWLRGTQFRIGAGYLRRFSRSTTVRAEVPYPCLFASGHAATCEYLGGPSTPRDILDASLTADANITDKLGASVGFRLAFLHAYGFDTAHVTTSTGAVVSVPDRSPTHWRNTRTLRLGVSYALYPFLELQLSVVNVFAERSADGTLRAPFQPVDTVFGLGASFSLDEIYVAVRGAPQNSSTGTGPLRGFAPMPLISRDDLLAPAPSDPQQCVIDRVLARTADDAAPMPPAPRMRATADERVALQAWLDPGTPTASCNVAPEPIDAGPLPPPNDPLFDVAPTCTSGYYWDDGDEGSRRMHPGRACFDCHRRSDGPDFHVAGTVFPSTHEPDDCNGLDGEHDEPAYVVITDAADRELWLEVNDVGNFHSGEDARALEMPICAKVVRGSAQRVMLGARMTGDCNSCHTQQGAHGAPGRIVAP